MSDLKTPNRCTPDSCAHSSAAASTLPLPSVRRSEQASGMANNATIRAEVMGFPLLNRGIRVCSESGSWLLKVLLTLRRKQGYTPYTLPMKYAVKFAMLALAVVAPIAVHAQVFRQVGMAPVNGVRKIASGNKPHSHRQIEALEQQWRQAQLKADTDTMSKMMADDYIGISANGMVQTKQQMVERVMNRKINITRMDVDELKVKIINGSTAVVTSQVDVDGEMDGRPLHGKYLYTRVYARQQGGGWKVVNFEATRMRQEPDKIADNK